MQTLACAVSAGNAADMKTVGLAFMALFTCLSCRGGVAVAQGEVYSWNFVLNRGGGPDAAALFQGDDKLAQGERVLFAFYENVQSENPVYTFTVNGSGSGMSGFFWFDFAQHGFFRDKQGIFSVSMLSGSVYLTSLSVCSNIDGVNYFATIQPTAIPEPVTLGSSLGLAGLAIVGSRRRRRNGVPVEA